MFSIALTLIALTGGMFLLAKTHKDNLGVFFKIIAYFIIIASFLNLICTAAHNAFKYYGKARFGHEMMMHKKFMDMGFYHGGMERYGCDAKCCTEAEGCMKSESADCHGKCMKEMKDSCVTNSNKKNYGN